MAFLVPENIETERLILRQFVENDWQDIHAYFSDEQATQHTFGRALTEGESWRTLASMIGHWHLRGYGPYAMEHKASNNVIGIAGFWYPIDWPEPEIKWALSRQYWGKAYASEATRSVQEVSLRCFPEKPLISFIHSDNAPSIRLALAVKAVYEKQLPFRGSNWHIYRHPEKI